MASICDMLQLSHGGNAGSNPAGDAKGFKALVDNIPEEANRGQA
jgi:hypothetical protein